MGEQAGMISTLQACAIGKLDAHAQAALVAAGDATPELLVEAAILRIEALNPQLNAVSFRGYDAARQRAAFVQGPMAGVPWLLKDGLDYIGMPNRSGSRSRRDASPGSIAFEFTDRFDDTGLVALGKTNAPEFGLLPTTEPLLYGPAHNPWALDRSPGGSSGGSAVAVASGMVPLAHAADGGGSIRIPASCCGLVGLKPSRGGNVRARDPHLIEDLLACDTLLSRSVRDAAWAYTIGAGRRTSAAGPSSGRLKIAVIRDNLNGMPPRSDVADVLERATQLCEALGHQIEQRAWPVDGRAVMASFRTIWGYLARDSVAHVASRIGSGAIADVLEPWTCSLANWSNALMPADSGQLIEQIGRASAAMAEFFCRYDVILSPVLRRSGLQIGELSPSRSFEHINELMFDYVSYTPLHNLTGNPAISLPLFTGADGTPIGSMFAAARGKEDTLLALAFELEEARPWADRWPTWSAATPPGCLERPTAS